MMQATINATLHRLYRNRVMGYIAYHVYPARSGMAARTLTAMVHEAQADALVMLYCHSYRPIRSWDDPDMIREGMRKRAFIGIEGKA